MRVNVWITLTWMGVIILTLLAAADDEAFNPSFDKSHHGRKFPVSKRKTFLMGSRSSRRVHLRSPALSTALPIKRDFVFIVCLLWLI